MGSWSMWQESPPGYGSHPRGYRLQFKALHLAGSSVWTRVNLFPRPVCCCICVGWQVTLFLEGCSQEHGISHCFPLHCALTTGHPLLCCCCCALLATSTAACELAGETGGGGTDSLSDLASPTFAPSQPNLVDLAVACACTWAGWVMLRITFSTFRACLDNCSNSRTNLCPQVPASLVILDNLV